MKYAHLLHAFYAEPWHLRPDYWRNFDLVLQRAMSGQEVTPVLPRAQLELRTAVHNSSGVSDRPIVGPINPESGEPIVPQMIVAGPVAIIPVHGALGKNLCLLDLWCGACDYSHVEQFAEMARGDAEIQVVIFWFRSPGGRSAGCEECGAAIAELQQMKPTIAFSDTVCCSAAYWLASQCGEVWSAPTAQIGNVGTIMAGEYTSGQWAQEGRKLELFTSSPLKATGADGKPWTEADRAYMTERMLQCDARIKNAVLAGRPAIDPAALDGRYFFGDKAANAPGQSALVVGMVDFIAGDLDEVMAVLWAARSGQ